MAELCDAAELCDEAALCDEAELELWDEALELLGDAAAAAAVPVVVSLAFDSVAVVSLSLLLVAVAVGVDSAVTPVTVCTVPSGPVYTPEMALPLPPTSSRYSPGVER